MSAGTKDYYDILGVTRDAAESDIKKAFRRKARETHPDVNAADDAEEQFKLINEAYDVLSDPQKRQMFDQYGTADPRAAGMGAQDIGDIFSGFGMDDLFSAFFGGGVGGQRRPRTEGRDMGAAVTITLEDAALGIEKEIALNRLVPCDECAATGSADDSGSATCSECQGAGQKRTYRKTFLGTVQTMAPCDKCGGSGSVIENPCAECDGQGRVPDREHVTIDVPAGIHDGQQIRVPGRGEAGVRGAVSGDLIVTVRVAEHEYIHREGDDLHCRATLSIAQAALGAELTVNGITDDHEVSVPPGSQHGETVRLRGQGMPRVRRAGRGDLIVHLGVEVPRKLDKRQKELLAELGESLGDPERKSTLEKLKDWLAG